MRVWNWWMRNIWEKAKWDVNEIMRLSTERFVWFIKWKKAIRIRERYENLLWNPTAWKTRSHRFHHRSLHISSVDFSLFIFFIIWWRNKEGVVFIDFVHYNNMDSFRFPFYEMLFFVFLFLDSPLIIR